jgi:hypothetical protein
MHDQRLMAAVPKAIPFAAFAGIYKSGFRQALLDMAALLKLLYYLDSANGVIQVMTFLDVIIGAGDVPVTSRYRCVIAPNQHEL